MSLTDVLNKIPAPLLADAEAWLTDLLRGQYTARVAGAIKDAVPATVARMEADGWNPVGTRDQAQTPGATPDEFVHDAIRSAEYLLIENAVEAGGLKTGANDVAQPLRLEEDAAVLAAVTPHVTIGMQVSDLVPLVAVALSKLPF